jgi:hypothetical protein
MADPTVRIADIAKATNTHTVRISETLAGLGISPGCHGRAGVAIPLGDAIKAAIVRQAMNVGLPFAAALDVGRGIEARDLIEMISEDTGCWLAITTEPGDPNRYVFAILKLDDLPDIAAGVRGNAVRLLDLYSIAHDVMAAALERKKQAASAQEHPVTNFTSTDRELNGVVLEDLAIAVVEKGRGKRVRLSVQQARELAAQLLSAAAEHDPVGGLN